jgi:hypothetical protein
MPPYSNHLGIQKLDEQIAKAYVCYFSFVAVSRKQDQRYIVIRPGWGFDNNRLAAGVFCAGRLIIQVKDILNRRADGLG